MSIADERYADLVARGLISWTGHAPRRDADAILSLAGGTWAVLVECNDDGYPDPSEAWDARLFGDGSALLGTYVRGRRETYFWKPVDDYSRTFDLWEGGR